VEQVWCGRRRLRGPLFIVRGGGRGGAAGRQWRRRFRTRRGKVWGAPCRRRLGGARALDGLARGGQERAASSPSLRYRRGRGLMMASSTAPVMANGGVRRCTGAVWRRHVQGERGRSSTTTRRRDALARPGRCPCALWRAMTGMGASGRAVFWPMPGFGELEPCRVMIIVARRRY
jgi:hypothetical protein